MTDNFLKIKNRTGIILDFEFEFDEDETILKEIIIKKSDDNI